MLRYVRAESELGAAFEAVRAGAKESVLAQEWIAGQGFGFCGLWWEGTRQRAFMHRRVRMAAERRHQRVRRERAQRPGTRTRGRDTA